MNLNQLIAELSLAGVKLSADGDQLRVRAAKGVLTQQIRDLLAKHKTELLMLLQHDNMSASDTDLPLVKVSREQDLPLSFPQEPIWFFDQMDSNHPSYNMQLGLRLHGSLNVVALVQSINEIIRRHEVLRTTFTQIDGQPIQIIASTLNLTMPAVDLRHLPHGEREIEAQRITTERSQYRFKLATGPLLRVLLLHLEEVEHVLLLTIHHIVFDGWSMSVFIRELAALYEAFCTSQPSLLLTETLRVGAACPQDLRHATLTPLPKLPVQYADYACWQRQWLQGEVEKTLLTYWTQQLQVAPAMLELPIDHPRPAVQNFRGTKQFLELPKSLSSALKSLSQQEGVSLFMTLLAAVQTLLYRYTGQQDIVVGSPIANRNLTEIEGLIGCFANVVVLRTDLSGNPTFRELLARVQKVALSAYAHQGLPFNRLVEELQPERSLSYNPLYQVVFALQKKPETLALKNLTLTSIMEASNLQVRLDLEFQMWECAEGLRGYLMYSTDLFEQATITRMMSHFQTLLSGIVTNPHQKLSELPLFTTAQRHQMLVEWNNTPADNPKHLCVHQLFVAQSLKTPDAVAVVFEDKQLTYRELNTKANKIAHHLQTLGVGPEVIVGICVERSLEMVIGLLGILKAGGAYLPLDPTDSWERLQLMLVETKPSVLLSQQLLLGRLPKHQAQVLCLDSSGEMIAQQSDENLTSKATPENLAYIIYSSRRGVLVEHRGVAGRLDWLQKTFALSESDAVLHKAPLTQDTAVWEIFWPLVHGGRLVIVLPQGEDSPKYLQRVIAEQKVSVIHFVPSVLYALVKNLSENSVASLSVLRCVLCSTEPLNNTVIEALFQHLNCELYNLYGLPEAGTELAAQVYRYRNTLDELLVSHLNNNLSMYVLDKYMQLVPIGVTGEIYVAGKGLFRGYLHHPEETAQRFVDNPFSEVPHKQLLRTGYLGRRLDDGKLEILGTGDRQVWISGFRIDLQEVEATILQNPSVNDCIVLARSTETFGQELVAYVVPAAPFSPQQLQSHLQVVLPPNSHLCTFVPLTSLPLTATGQVDEQALTRTEVIDSDLVQRWEKQLQTISEIDQFVVTVQAQVENLPALHLSTLVPKWQTTLIQPFEVSTDAFLLEVPNKVAQAKPQAMAFSDGGPLVRDEHAPKTLTEALLCTAAKYPDKGLIHVQPNSSVIIQTYASLLAEAKCILTGLDQMGLKPYEKVILQIENLRDYFPIFWACILGGITPVTVAVPSSYEETNGVVNKLYQTWHLLDQPCILASDHLISPLSGLGKFLPITDLKVFSIDQLRNYPSSEYIHPSHPHDIVFLQLTSGSTGVPKCIQETHQGIICHIHASQQFNDYNSSDISLNWLPVDHVVPLLTFHLKDIYLGCQQIQVKTNLILADPLKWLDLIETYQVTHTWSPNFGYKLVSDRLSKVQDRVWNLSSIKFFMNAGEQVTLPVVRDFWQQVIPFKVRTNAMQPAFGMAEVCTCMTYNNSFNLKSGWHRFRKDSLGGRLEAAQQKDATTTTISFIDLGAPVPGTQIRIVDENNQLLSEGVIGRLQIKGDVVTPGYLNNAIANQKAFVGDGWFDTGDLGFILNSRLTLTGRQKEIIIINGANYYCYEIEAVVNGIDGVESTYVGACAVDNPSTGTEGLAIFFTPVVEGLEQKINLIKAIQAKIVSYLGISPTCVVPIAKQDFPKTTSGKIQRTQLKKLLEAGHFQEILQEIDIQLQNANTLPDWFYRKIWRPKEVVSLNRQLIVGKSLVFFDSLGLSTYLCAELSQFNRDCVRVQTGADFAKLTSNDYRINPHEPKHYLQLLKSLSKDGFQIDLILHLWTYNDYAGEISSLDELEQAQYQGTYSLLFLAQALAQVQGHNQAQLYVIASHTQPTSPVDKIAYEKTPILGLMKTISQEMPALRCRHIDLPVDPVEVNATRILQEIRVMQSDKEVAYRNGQRLIPRLSKVNLTQEKKQEIPLKHGGMYLLTGGLGGIGVEIAKYLLTHYQVRLLLVSRTSLPQRNAWEAHLEKADDTRSQSIKTLLVLEQLGGEILYQAVDVCDFAQLQQAVEQAKSHWKSELDGVIHLAGIFHECLLQEETQEKFAATLRPKLLGTWALHQLVKERPNSIFISFSSVNGFFASATVGAYAAANSFLDGFSYYQRYQNSLRSYCFAWSMWDEVGMSRNIKDKELFRALGYHTITIEQGLYSLLAGLYHNQAQLFVGLDGSNQHIQEYTETTSSQTQELLAYYTTKAEQIPMTRLQELVVCDRFQTQSNCQFLQIQEMPMTADGNIDYRELPVPNWASSKRKKDFVAPRDPLESQLAQIWEELLEIRPIGITDNFFSLGGHSVLAVRLIAQIQKSFGKEIALSTIFEKATIEHLASILRQQSSFLNQSPLVPIQPNGSKRPFFCVPGSDGNTTNLHNLADHLGKEQPFYGLQPLGLDGESKPHTRIEDMAAYYIEAIQSIQTSGPYLLGGYSFGGMVAFEMATQLHQQGYEVALLALLDSSVPGYKTNKLDFDGDDAAWLNTIASVYENIYGKSLNVSEEALKVLAPDEQLNYFKQRLQMMNLLPADVGIKQLRRMMQVFKTNFQTACVYMPQAVYPAQVTFFKASEMNAVSNAYSETLDELGLDWDKFSAQPVDIHLVPGDHITMLSEPHVQVLAQQLTMCIERSQVDD